jgi:serine/threonine protein kinase
MMAIRADRRPPDPSHVPPHTRTGAWFDPAAGMSLTAQQFAEALRNSGLVSAEELASLAATRAGATDARDLARELVQSGKLTYFQANTVYKGRVKALLYGEYVVLEKLGAGGMAHVFKARHRRMKRVVALKVLPGASMSAPGAVARFQREVEAAAKLNHPNIVTAYDAGEAHGMHFLVMEYVDGQDLSAISRQRGPLPLDEAIDYMLQAARGLAYAHAHGVIHRDVKPANLLLAAERTVKILDMGLARVDGLEPAVAAVAASEAGEEASGLTRAGEVLGTVDYMAPEQAVNTHHATPQSDVYALGCTLFKLLTARPLYAGDTFIAKVLAHREQPLPDLCAVRPDAPRELADAFERMVAKDPAARYGSMAQVAAALQTCLELVPAGADPQYNPAAADPSGSLAGYRLSIGEDEQTLGRETFAGRIASAGSGSSLAGQPQQSPPQPGGSTAAAVQDLAAALAAAASAHAGRGIDSRTYAPPPPSSLEPAPELGPQAMRRPRRPVLALAAIGALAVAVVCGIVIVVAVHGRHGGSEGGDATPPIAGNTPARPAPSTPQPAVAAEDADRRAAEWVLRMGGSLGARLSDGADATDILSADKLPSAPFRLTAIDLTQSRGILDDLALESLRGLVGLESLKLGGPMAKFSDRGLSAIGTLRNLQSLALDNSGITDAGLIYLQSLVALNALSLRGTQVTERGLADLSGLSHLQALDLRDTAAAGGVLPLASGAWPDLAELRVPGAAITPGSAELLGRLKDLRLLEVLDSRLTAADLAALRAALPQCRIIADGR